MMDKSLALSILKPAHGLFNIVVLMLFLYQGWLGYAIRRARLSGSALSILVIKRHRRLGPLATVLAIAGYLAGISLVLYDKGNLFEHPLHLATGSLLVLVLLATFGLSREIRGVSPGARASHFMFGILVLTLFIAETVIGLGVLF